MEKEDFKWIYYQLIIGAVMCSVLLLACSVAEFFNRLTM